MKCDNSLPPKLVTSADTFEVTDGRKVLVSDVGLEPMTLRKLVHSSTN